MRTTDRVDSRRRRFAAIDVSLGALVLLSVIAALPAGAQSPPTGAQTTTTTSSSGLPGTTTTSSSGLPGTTTTNPRVTTTTAATSVTTSSPTTTTHPKVTTTTNHKVTTTTNPRVTTTTNPRVTTTTVRGPSTTTTGRPLATTTTALSSVPTTGRVGQESNGRLSIDIVARAGAALADGKVVVSGAGLLPGSTVRIYVHSAPTLIGSAAVSSLGRFGINLTMPADLVIGAHHIVVRGLSHSASQVTAQESFTVASGGVFGSIGSIPAGPLAGYVPFVPGSHPRSLLVTFAGLAVVVAAVGSVMGKGRGGGGSGGGGRDGSPGGAREGYLEDVELEREEQDVSGDSRGDRSRSWRWRGTRRLDHYSRVYPSRISAISPVVGRVAVDGDYLRAMFGSCWLILCVMAVGLGLVAAASTGWYAVPPASGIFLMILGLSILDATLGYLAGTAFFVGVLGAGHVATAADLREAAGIVLVWFAVPLAAAALRPLRRNVQPTITSLWDRSADVVLSGLFGAWAAMKMTGALSGLAGYELPIGQDLNIVAVSVLGFLALRMVIETIAANHYPQRLSAVHHEGELESGTLQVGVSLVIQIAIFIFIAVAFLGSTWALYVGAALFFAPLVPWLFADRIPKSGPVTKWLPRSLVKWTLIIVSGLLLGSLLENLISGGPLRERVGFIFLPLPVLIFWALELFEDETDARAGVTSTLAGVASSYEPDRDQDLLAETAPTSPERMGHMTTDGDSGPTLEDSSDGLASRAWLLRLAGVPLVAIAVFVVVAHGVGG
jgi:hypothetical protein